MSTSTSPTPSTTTSSSSTASTKTRWRFREVDTLVCLLGNSAPWIPELRVELLIHICGLIVLRHIVRSPDTLISVLAWDLLPKLVRIKATGRPKVIVSLVVEFVCFKRLVLWRRSSEQGFPGHVLIVISTASHVETALNVGSQIGQKGWIAADEGGELSFIHNSKVW